MKKIDLVLKLFGAVFLLLIGITLFNRATSQESPDPMKFIQKGKLNAVGKDPLGLGWYRLSGKKISGILAGGASAFVDGVVEGWEFDGRIGFQRKGWTDNPYGYLGQKRYEVERSQSFKRGFYHQADDFRKIGYLGSGVLIGIGGAKVNTKWWHYAVDFGIGFGVSAFWKRTGMNWIRYDTI